MTRPRKPKRLKHAARTRNGRNIAELIGQVEKDIELNLCLMEDSVDAFFTSLTTFQKAIDDCLIAQAKVRDGLMGSSAALAAIARLDEHHTTV